MRNRIIFVLSLAGMLAGLASAYYFTRSRPTQPPVFAPVSNPYATAIYSNGIIESAQPGGSNINLYPEVAGQLVRIAAREGQRVKAGELLYALDDSVPRANREVAAANLATARDQYDKRLAAYQLDPHSISQDVVDTARDAQVQARAALKAADALLAKYTVRAPVDGVVLAVNATVGSYVSAQGSYDAYTQGFDPVVVMGGPQEVMAVRCYVDEILVSRLPAADHIHAQMSLRGSERRIPLDFVRVQPYVSPKIQLSNQRQEKVDLRVLPVVFSFHTQGMPPVYPGQLVDVFIGQQP